ncbi:MAG TPA: hypothetical protein VLR26_08260 [Frankiaceae bacterium]|nr:hypothetical protein [Frankiaceae bacterium]
MASARTWVVTLAAAGSAVTGGGLVISAAPGPPHVAAAGLRDPAQLPSAPELEQRLRGLSAEESSLRARLVNAQRQMDAQSAASEAATSALPSVATPPSVPISARRTSGVPSSSRPSSHATTGASGTTKRPSSHAITGASGASSRPAAHTRTGASGTSSRPAAHTTTGASGTASRPAAHTTTGASGTGGQRGAKEQEGNGDD